MRNFTTFLILFLLSQYALADKITNAYKQIQKGEYEKAKKLLDKELEKDSLSAGAFHIYSVYYFSRDNQAYNVDSSYLFILKAIKQYPNIDSKDSINWAKEEITIENAEKLKKAIEERAFHNVQKANTIKDYQYFIDYFKTAKQIPNVIKLRNEIAWNDASITNTLESYQTFIQTYPKAEQIPEAKKRRDKFIYDDLTADKKQSSYLNFLKKYNNNYYVKNAQNELFYFLTLEHNIENYHNFIKSYPNSDKVQQAWDWLLVLFAKENGLNNFLQQYPNYPQKNKIQGLLAVENLDYIPTYESELYGFIDENGQRRIDPEYEYINKDYLCESITDNFLIINVNANLGLVNKIGEEILKPQFDDIKFLNTGVFKVSKNGRSGLYQQNGLEILPLQYDDIQVLNTHFLKIKKNRRWGLVSYNGKVILEPKYAKIDTLNKDFTTFRLDDFYDVKTNKELFRLAQERDIQINLRFDEVELLDKYVLVEEESKYGLLDKNARFIFDIEYKFIEQVNPKTWIAQKSDFWKVYDTNARPISDKSFQSIAYSQNLIVGKLDDKWGAIDTKGEEILPFEYDSLALVGDILLRFKGKKREAMFMANPEKIIKDFSVFKNLRAEKGNYPQADTFLYYEDRYKRKGLFAQSGKKILSPKYNSLYILDNQTVSVSVNGRYGLVDTLQKLVLPIRYAGINNISDGFKTTLLNRKFGIYHYGRKINIQPIYEAVPKMFTKNDSSFTFLAKKRGKFGVINEKNKALIPFKFLDIKPWKDSTALVQVEEDKWQFFDFSKKEEKQESPSFEAIKVILENTQGIFLEVENQDKKGLWHNQKGQILEASADLIQNIGTQENPIFFVEKKLENAKYEVKYINVQGKVIWNKVLKEIDYFKLVCE